MSTSIPLITIVKMAMVWVIEISPQYQSPVTSQKEVSEYSYKI